MYSFSQDIFVATSQSGLACRVGRSRFSLNRPFVTHGGRVNRTIKELFQQLQQFLSRKDLDWAVRNGLVDNEFPKILFRQNDRPNQLAERNSLMSAASANFGIALLDVRFTLAEQPLSQMAVIS